MFFFDTHAHINDQDLYPQAEDIFARAVASGVTRIVVPGYDRGSSLRAIELAERFETVYAAVGFHPQDAHNVSANDLADLATWSQHEKVVAIGEIGLDYHYDHPPRTVQDQVFREQIRFARSQGLPIIIHDRDAHEDILSALREEDAQAIGGIMHCFSGSVEMMQMCVEMNFYISLGGPVTYKNAKRPVQIAETVPAERLLLETDAPWLSPVPYRGKPNEPAYVRHIAEKIAEVRGIGVEELAALTYANALRLFGMGR